MTKTSHYITHIDIAAVCVYECCSKCFRLLWFVVVGAIVVVVVVRISLFCIFFAVIFSAKNIRAVTVSVCECACIMIFTQL